MTINPNNASLAVARELMEKALLASNGIRVSFPDKAAAERMQRACNQARTAQRRVNARVFSMDKGQGVDLADGLGVTGTGPKGHDPDAIRTHYDSLVTWVEQGSAAGTDNPPPWVLVIAKPDLSTLKIEEF